MSQRGRSDPGHGSGAPRYPGTFLLAFREAAAGMNWQVRRWIGDMVECADAQGKDHMIGLENLYRRARRAQRQEWPDLIGEFLRTVSGADQGEGLPTDLAAVSGQLLVRLGHPLKVMPQDAKVWSQPLAGTDLCLNLVIDYPNRMSYVTEQLVADSGIPGADWLERGLANLRARTPPDCFQVIHEESGMLLAGVADAYDSSRALLLEQLLPQARSEGYFVILPGRDELLVLPVTLKAIPHVHLLKVLAEKNFKSVPYPISDQVYWVHRGVWRLFPIDVRAKEVTVQPPPEFEDILDRLVPRQDNGSKTAEAPGA
jgi:hypothetical protein